MEKQIYEKPMMEIDFFETEDIIMASGNSTDETPIMPTSSTV